MSAPEIMRRTLSFQGLWLGANGLRAGWRLLLFLAVLISCLLGFREVVVHIPTVNRMVETLREGRLVVSAALIAEFGHLHAKKILSLSPVPRELYEANGPTPS